MNAASRKWLELFLEILSYEVEATDGQLLSEGADRLVDKHPIVGRIFIVATGVIVTLHLANLLEERYDVMAKNFWRKNVSPNR